MPERYPSIIPSNREGDVGGGGGGEGYQVSHTYCQVSFLHKSICCGYSLESILMSTHNIGFYGELTKITLQL